jgi:Leucine-rich repeat (LRR) protein
LHFASNRITLLPVTMAELDSWEEVDSDGNDILSPPPEVVTLGAVAIRDMLRKFLDAERTRVLNMSGLGINYIPNEVFVVKGLTELFLNENKFKAVPEDIKKLTELKRLHLNANLLRQFPLVICDLPLEKLAIGWNRLSTIPEELGVMSNLQILHLDSNGVVEVAVGSLGML